MVTILVTNLLGPYHELFFLKSSYMFFEFQLDHFIICRMWAAQSPLLEVENSQWPWSDLENHPKVHGTVSMAPKLV